MYLFALDFFYDIQKIPTDDMGDGQENISGGTMQILYAGLLKR